MGNTWEGWDPMGMYGARLSFTPSTLVWVKNVWSSSNHPERYRGKNRGFLIAYWPRRPW